MTYINETLCGRLRELKNDAKVQLGNPKVVAVAYESFQLESDKHAQVTFKTGFYIGGRN